MDIFYRLKSPTDLADLNDSFLNSSFKGFYLFLDNIELTKDKSAFNKKSTNYLKAIKSLNKKVILTFNFNNRLDRPDYHSPKIHSSMMERLKSGLKSGKINKERYEEDKKYFEIIIKNNETKIKKLKSLEKTKKCSLCFEEILDHYLQVKEYLENEGLGRWMKTVSNHEKTEVIGFEVPVIANYKREDLNDSYFKDIQDSITKINNQFVDFSKQYGSENFIYPLTFMTQDIRNKNKFFVTQMKYLRDFKRALIWVIDSNELYNTRDNKNMYFKYIEKLNRDYHIYIKYVGVKQLQKYKKIEDEISIIFREDAYSGYNINIRRYAKPIKTRDLLDPKDLKHKNDTDLSKEDEKADFHCNCSICQKLGIDNYDKVDKYFYSDRIEEDSDFLKKISPKTDVKDEEEYRRRKRRRFQAMYRKIHNFETADKLIFLDLDEFISKYPSISEKIDLM